MILAAARSVLLEVDPALAVIAAGRVFAVELPEREAAEMPRQAVVVSPAGGPEDVSFQQITTDSLRVLCFGKTITEAAELSEDVHRRLKWFYGGNFAGLRVHSFTRSSGRVFFRDPETDWPVFLEGWIMRASDAATPP